MNFNTRLTNTVQSHIVQFLQFIMLLLSLAVLRFGIFFFLLFCMNWQHFAYIVFYFLFRHRLNRKANKNFSFVCYNHIVEIQKNKNRSRVKLQKRTNRSQTVALIHKTTLKKICSICFLYMCVKSSLFASIVVINMDSLIQQFEPKKGSSTERMRGEKRNSAMCGREWKCLNNSIACSSNNKICLWFHLAHSFTPTHIHNYIYTYMFGEDTCAYCINIIFIHHNVHWN